MKIKPRGNNDVLDSLERRQLLDFRKCECEACGKRKDLELHHKKLLSEYPELKLVESNLITLCKKCHDKVHGR